MGKNQDPGSGINIPDPQLKNVFSNNFSKTTVHKVIYRCVSQLVAMAILPVESYGKNHVFLFSLQMFMIVCKTICY